MRMKTETTKHMRERHNSLEYFHRDIVNILLTIAQNPIDRALRTKIDSHESKKTDSLSLNDSHLSRNGVVFSSHRESNIGEIVDFFAIDGKLPHEVGCCTYCKCKLVDFCLWPSNQRSSRINDGRSWFSVGFWI